MTCPTMRGDDPPQTRCLASLAALSATTDRNAVRWAAHRQWAVRRLVGAWTVGLACETPCGMLSLSNQCLLSQDHRPGTRGDDPLKPLASRARRHPTTMEGAQPPWAAPHQPSCHDRGGRSHLPRRRSAAGDPAPAPRWSSSRSLPTGGAFSARAWAWPKSRRRRRCRSPRASVSTPIRRVGDLTHGSSDGRRRPLCPRRPDELDCMMV